MAMRRLVFAVALALIGSASLSPSPAEAAMCFEFTLEPASPRIGEPVAVEVKSLWATGTNKLSLRVWTPERSTSVLGLARVPGEERWRGSLVFDRPGTWALQTELAVPSNEYPCFYLTVEVTSPTATERTPTKVSFTPWAPIAVTLLLSGAALLVWRRRSRRSSTA